MPKFLSNILDADRVDTTSSTNKFTTAGDISKLAGIAAGAEVNQNAFSTVAVSGQTSVTADSKTDTLTLVAGTNVTITTDAATDSITINSTASGGGNSFGTIAVSGQSDVIADAANDTLTFIAGSNVTLTTNATNDSITIAATDTNTTYSAGNGLGLSGTTFSLDTPGTITGATTNAVTADSHTHAVSLTAADVGALPISGGTLTGSLKSQSSTGAINVATAGVPSFESYSDGAGNASYMIFHRNAAYGVRFGLDTDNILKVGGFSMGANAYTIWHSGNFQTLTAGNGISGSSFNGSTARTWSIGAGTGITVGAADVGLTSITAGSTTAGALRYNGTTAANGQMNGSTNITADTTRLNYSGIFYAVGLRFGASGSSAYSDVRLKKDIKDIPDASKLIYALRPKTYKLKAELGGIDQYHYGLVAQEVVEDLHSNNIEKTAFLQYPREEDEYFGIDYTQLVAPLIATVQEQKSKIDILESRITKLEQVILALIPVK